MFKILAKGVPLTLGPEVLPYSEQNWSLLDKKIVHRLHCDGVKRLAATFPFLGHSLPSSFRSILWLVRARLEAKNSNGLFFDCPFTILKRYIIVERLMNAKHNEQAAAIKVFIRVIKRNHLSTCGLESSTYHHHYCWHECPLTNHLIMLENIHCTFTS